MQIDTSDLPKKVAKTLTDHVIRYIEGYRLAKGRAPNEVHLAAKDYDALHKAVADKKDPPGRLTYKGVLLRRASS